MLGATGIEHVTAWRLCSCDLGLLARLNLASMWCATWERKTCFPHRNEKCCNSSMCKEMGRE